MSEADAAVATMPDPRAESKPMSPMFKAFIAIGAICVVAAMLWAALTADGNPDPTTKGTSNPAAILDIGVLVFREGLECILVLSAITASLMGAKNLLHRRAVFIGAGVGAIATVITWFIAITIVSDLTQSFDALQVQAWTGLLAIFVLLLVMNWFFHKMYWGGWIAMHNKKKKELLTEERKDEATIATVIWGLGTLGFASFYREGVEVVLFLQSYYLQFSTHIVYLGALVGLFFAAIVAVLTFIAHHKLPYRRMLELTGIMLGVVLLIMVGEQAQEMQQAGWISTTTIPWLVPYMPDWMGLWFSVFPNIESLVAQFLAAAAVIGSFVVARQQAQKELKAAPAPRRKTA
ncbi:MAG: FTR1 family protein [Verrucomicrobiota bacterium]